MTSPGPPLGDGPAPTSALARGLRRVRAWLGGRRRRGLPEGVLDAVPDALFLVDADGRVRAANAAAAELLGVDPEALLGAEVAERVLAPADRDRFEEALRQAADGELPPGAPARAVHADGAEIDVELTIRLVSAGAPWRAAVCLRDRREALADAAAREAAEGHRRVLRTIVDTLPDPVVAVDRTGRVVFRNRASVEVPHAPRPADGRLAEGPWRAAEAVMSAGAPAVDDEGPDPEGAVWRTTRVPVRDRAGDVAGLVAISRDVTAQKAEEARLLAEKQTAEAAARANTEFLATTSHEIRTLMSGVTGMTALLLDTPLDAEQREYVDTVRTSSDALLTIVNDVLDLSKMEAGMLEIEERPFRVRGLVGEALRMVLQQAAAKGLGLHSDVDADVPEDVLGDALRVKQVLANLLSNAVKFTAEGAVRVHVGLAPESAPGAPVLAVTVEDSGVGIAPERLAAVFEPFAQAEASTARTHGGTGLGLTICHRLVGMMGGALGAESEPGRGSRFRFTVPVHPGEGPEAFTLPPDSVLVDVPLADLRAAVAVGASPAEAPPTEAPPTEAPPPEAPPPAEAAPVETFSEPGAVPEALSGDGRSGDGLPEVEVPGPERGQVLSMDGILPSARVLLAEDNPLVQKVTTLTLRRLGYRPDVAADGVAAVEAVRARPYDVILMDIMMPRMDGLEATRAIRADAGPHPMPAIVALTANAMRGDRQRCLDAGCDDYLAKPVVPQVLAATIERALRDRADAEAA